MFNKMISLFEKPEGKMGKFISKMMNSSNRKMHKALIKKIDGTAENILEIGYGGGSMLKLLRKNFPSANLYGIDISKDMYEAALKNFKSDEKIFLSLGDCTAMNYDDNMFDFIITTDTCYFWTDAKKALSEISRVLKTNGTFGNAYNRMYAKCIQANRKNSALYDNQKITDATGNFGLTISDTKKAGLTCNVLWFKKIK